MTMTQQEERALIRQVLAGDTDRFEALVRANEKGVYALALRMLGSEQDALDASQEAFFRAYRALGSFRGDSRFSVWLYRLTANVCLDALRRAGRWDAVSLTDEEGGELTVPDSRNDPQRLLERRELRRAVRAALDALPAAFRLVLVLRDIEGLSYDEIAQVTGLEPGTVKSRIFRARRKMAALLAPDGNFSDISASYNTSSGKGGSGL